MEQTNFVDWQRIDFADAEAEGRGAEYAETAEGGVEEA